MTRRVRSVLLAGLAIAAACGEPAARQHRVVMEAVGYAPATLTVAAGDTVTWVNADPVPHTVTLAGHEGAGDHVEAGAEFRWVAEGRGTLRYTCRYHGGMTGVVVVE